MFDYFSESAIRVIMHAQEISCESGHNFVGNEQLLIGILAEGKSTAAKVLKRFGCDLTNTWKAVDSIIGRGNDEISAEIPFTRELKYTLEEASHLGDQCVEPKHIALAILKRKNSNAYQAMQAVLVRSKFCMSPKHLYYALINSQKFDNTGAFITELYLYIEKKELRYELITQFLEENVKEVNVHFINIFPEYFDYLLSNISPTNRESFLRDTVELGDLVGSLLVGERRLNIEIGIVVLSKVLSITTQDFCPALWAEANHHIAFFHTFRLEGNSDENIELAIISYERALRVRTRASTPYEWARTITQLADAYYLRGQGDRSQNIEQSIAYYEKALSVVTKETRPTIWANTLNRLADAYRKRLNGNFSQNIEQAIRHYEEVLPFRNRELNPGGWARTMDSLGDTYSVRIKGYRTENIERAISSYEQALTVRTKKEKPILWAKTTACLAKSYKKRIQGSRVENINVAIYLYEQALTVLTVDSAPSEWAESMTSLADAYCLFGDSPDSVNLAFEACEKALEVRTANLYPLDWSETVTVLGNAYRKSRDKTPLRLSSPSLDSDYWKHDKFEISIFIYEQALTVRTRETYPIEWAEVMTNIANAYRDRNQRDFLYKETDFSNAIDAYRQALEVRTQRLMPIEWAETTLGLATLYLNNFYEDKRRGKEGIALHWKVIDFYQAQRMPYECRQAAQSLGCFFIKEKEWISAVKAYKIALHAAELVFQDALFQSGQEKELEDVENLYLEAAYAHARVGKLRDAITILEQGRARGTNYSLTREKADLVFLEKETPALYRQYQSCIEVLQQIEREERSAMVSSSPEFHHWLPIKLFARARSVRHELQSVIEKIREQPNYKNFLLQSSWDDVAAAVQIEEPLVYITSSFHGSLVLVAYKVTNSEDIEVQPIWLDDLTGSFLTSVFYGFRSLQRIGDRSLLDFSLDETVAWMPDYQAQTNDIDPWLETLDILARQLWDLLMLPLITFLREHSFTKAVLIPISYLNFFPLHATWTEDEASVTGRLYALDLIQFSYSPNAQALHVARGRIQKESFNQLLVVNEPRPTHANPLPYSEKESKSALHYFSQSLTIEHEQATRKRVLSELSNYDVIHLSCHGKANFDIPLNSGLLMADNELITLRDFLDLQLRGVRLAVLSACETGLSGISNPDEVASIATGLFRSGVAGVVSSLWLVPELSTMILMSRFYVLWREEKCAPSEALVLSQRWLKASSPLEVLEHCQKFIPELSDPTGELSEAGKVLKRDLRLDFSHPYYWAAFLYTGV